MNAMRRFAWIVGLASAVPLVGCSVAPTLQPATVPEGAMSGAVQAEAPGYAVQQRGPFGIYWARQRIRTELERGYPDYSPTVLSLNVMPGPAGRIVRFRARLRVIGIAGPSLPLLYRVEGYYDRVRDRVVETSRTSIQRGSRWRGWP